MKANSIVRSTAVIIAALFFCAIIIVASPLTSEAQSGTSQAAPRASKMDRAEARINELHSKLKITQGQEEQWNKVAQAMRDNATTMETLIKERKEKEQTSNAVENLKSYAKITDAHASGLNNFIAAFEPLYASMSEDQKKTADTLFTKYTKKRSKKR